MHPTVSFYVFITVWPHSVLADVLSYKSHCLFSSCLVDAKKKKPEYIFITIKQTVNELRLKRSQSNDNIKTI